MVMKLNNKSQIYVEMHVLGAMYVQPWQRYALSECFLVYYIDLLDGFEDIADMYSYYA